jgi:hypothetical protein
MVAFVMDGQDVEGVPWVEAVTLECTPDPLFAGLALPDWAPEYAPHAAKTEPDAPIAAEAMIAASTVALHVAGNLEVLVRISTS